MAAVTMKPRTIVLCFDGTTNEYNDTVSVPTGPLESPQLMLRCWAEHKRRQILFLTEERRLQRTALLLPGTSHAVRPVLVISCRAAWHRNVVQSWSRFSPL